MQKYILSILLLLSLLLNASVGFCNEIEQADKKQQNKTQISQANDGSEKTEKKQEVVDENKNQQINKNPSGTAIKSVGGIKPVSPGELAERLDYFVTTVHEKSKPIAAKAGKLSFIIIGLILIVGFFISKTIMRWAGLAIIAVALGLLLFFNADTLNGLLIWASSILNGGKT